MIIRPENLQVERNAGKCEIGVLKQSRGARPNLWIPRFAPGKAFNAAMLYPARDAYRSAGLARSYVADRFGGLLGRHRYFREQTAVTAMINRIPASSTILDCPSGNGRWWPHLAQRASAIIGIDISQEMLDESNQQRGISAIPVYLIRGDALSVSLPDHAVDFVFSHALMKHLPRSLQYSVLSEFGRVARKGVVCSFGIFDHLSYELWRRRRLKDSYPMMWEELEWMAEAADLNPIGKRRCTTVIGTEHIIFFERR